MFKRAEEKEKLTKMIKRIPLGPIANNASLSTVYITYYLLVANFMIMPDLLDYRKNNTNDDNHKNVVEEFNQDHQKITNMIARIAYPLLLGILANGQISK